MAQLLSCTCMVLRPVWAVTIITGCHISHFRWLGQLLWGRDHWKWVDGHGDHAMHHGHFSQPPVTFVCSGKAVHKRMVMTMPCIITWDVCMVTMTEIPRVATGPVTKLPYSRQLVTGHRMTLHYPHWWSLQRGFAISRKWPVPWQ